MTERKTTNLPKGDRPPSYVDRMSGSAELRISPETWDRWVDEGRLPPCAPGFPPSTPRWRWADIDRKLSGGGTSDTNRFIDAAGAFGRGAQKEKRRDVA